jgi:hypothetical protein
LVGDLAVSNFAHGSPETSTLTKDWDALRVTSEALESIIACARDIAKRTPRGFEARDNEGADSGPEQHYADDPRWPEELGIALTAWRAACNAERQGKRPGAFIREWLARTYPEMSDEAKKRIATVANWDKAPGAGKK